MTPLHVRSNTSLLAGGSPVRALAARAKALGFRALALTDVDGLYGAVPFWVAAREAGLTPLLGAEVGDVVAITRSRTGWANLCSIISRRKLGLPCDLADFQEDLHFLTESPETARALRGRVDRLWMEVVRPGRSWHHEQRVRAAARELGLGMVASLDARFAAPGDYRALEILSAIAQKTTLRRAVPPPRENYLRGDVDFSDVDDRSDAIAEDATWEFLPAPSVFPTWPESNPPAILRGLCEAGLRKRYAMVPPDARPRLERELGVIEKLGFAEYFLVVHDIVREARTRGAPVAGRGSGASSLVAYVLGITNVCPLRTRLQFERFLHEGRDDWPDLDVDFCWRVRDDIIDYAFRRHGRDRVAMVSSHITFQHRSAFREAARVHGLSDRQISRMQKTGESPAAIVDDARRILRYPHHLSVHPGGIVIGRGPIDRHVPVERADKGVIIAQLDKDGVEAVGLVKIDLLGNRAVSTLRAACDLAGGVDAEAIPDGDATTAALLREGRTVGCNQLESPAMRHLLRQMRPGGVADLMKALALIRPGAASIGMKERFIRRHRGLEKWRVDPLLAHVLGDTYGVMLYEDDTMLVASALAGVPLAEGDRYRKKVKNCLTDDDRRRVSAEFFAACARAGTPHAVARDLWIQMAKFNEYSFCMSHAASYAQLAYAVACLKAHRPLAFWTAALNNNMGMYEKRVYVEEARRDGVRTLLPCINRSGVEFEVDGDAIRTGLGSVAGLEARAVEAILAGRPFGSLFDFIVRVPASLPSARALVLCGALDFLGRPRTELLMELRAVWRRRRPVRVPPMPDMTELEKRRAELEVTGLSVVAPTLSVLWPGPRPRGVVDSRVIDGPTGRRVRLLGVMDALRLADTKRGETMEFVTLEDEHGLFDVTLFPSVYRRFARVCRTGGIGPYIVEGRVDDQHGARTVTASRIESIENRSRHATISATN